MVLGLTFKPTRSQGESLSILSQFGHFVSFSLSKPKMRLECGALITSIDIDVGCKSIGKRNKGRNDTNVHEYMSESRIGEVEKKIVPLLNKLFIDLEIPVTFAIRGQLTEIENSILDLLLKSPIDYDIGAHGYYHRTFTSLSETEAQNELKLISKGMNKFGIKPRSFVFPRNQIAHLPLLEKFGYKCYREKSSLIKDKMCINKVGQLYDVHPSFHLGCTYNPIFLDKIIELAVVNKLPFHIWFHPRDLYETRGSTGAFIRHVLFPLYKYAKKKEDQGLLTIETMHSVINKIKPTSSGKEHEF